MWFNFSFYFFHFFQARSILERHLVIADRVYTMNDLKHMSNETIILPSVRDSLRIRVKEEDKRKYIDFTQSICQFSSSRVHRNDTFSYR
jgi:hypothetical protein